MSSIEQVKVHLAFLKELKDPETLSVAFDKNKKLESFGKRCCFVRFLHWVIHILTGRPRNRKIDEVTQEILNGLKNVENLTEEEKTLADFGLTNLSIMNKNNDGDRALGKEIFILAKRINRLPVVEQLQGGSTNPQQESTNTPNTSPQTNKQEKAQEQLISNEAPQQESTTPQQPVIATTNSSTPLANTQEIPPKKSPSPAEILKNLLPKKTTEDQAKAPAIVLPKGLENFRTGKQTFTVDVLISYAKFYLDQPKSNENEELSFVVKRFEECSTQVIAPEVLKNKETFIKLYPLLTKDEVKVTILAKALDALISDHIFDSLFKSAANETPEIWRKAYTKFLNNHSADKKNKISFDAFAKTFLVSLPIDLIAIFLKGQLDLDNQDFTLKLFAHFTSLENQKILLATVEDPLLRLTLLVKNNLVQNPDMKDLINASCKIIDKKIIGQFVINIKKEDAAAVPQIIELIKSSDSKEFSENLLHNLLYVDVTRTLCLAHIHENLPYDVVKKQALDILKSKDTNKYDAHNCRLIAEILSLLPHEIACEHINMSYWKNDICKWYPDSDLKNQLIPFNLILPFMVNAKHLETVFTMIFNNKDERYYEMIFTHLEKEPWKAIMIAGLYKGEKKLIQQWIMKHHIMKGRPVLPLCAKFFHEKFTSSISDYEDMHKKFFDFFKPAKNIIEKSQIFKDLDETLQEYFLYTLKKKDDLKGLGQDLLYMHPDLLKIGLLDDEARKNILYAIQQNKHASSEKVKTKMKNLASDLKRFYKNDKEILNTFEEFLEDIEKSSSEKVEV
jgi:hypothetical protein